MRPEMEAACAEEFLCKTNKIKTRKKTNNSAVCYADQNSQQGSLRLQGLLALFYFFIFKEKLSQIH